MAKFDIQKGDLIIVRRATARDEDGRILFVPDAHPKAQKVIKVFPHGVKCNGWGYVHNNCIISKVDERKD